ncbi:MAG: hypothetical protein K2H78_01950, partial [Clostridia bacterium]|nr:hypothetical protein [Clostridia bacterium]
SDHITSFDERGYQYLNSEVVFYAGHGYGTKNGNKGDGFAFPIGDLGICSLTEMEICKVAVWSACYSANTGNIFKTSMMHEAVEVGAQSAVGWPDTIAVGSSRTFTNRLFNKLSKGETLEKACKYAKDGVIWVWDNVRDYQIAGDVNTRIIFSNVKRKKAQDIRNLEAEMQSRMKVSTEWYKHDNGDGSYRVYKTINGCLTNDFYDYEMDNEKIVSISRSNIVYNNQEVLPINYQSIEPLQSIKIDNRIFNNLVDVEIHNVYYIEGEKAIPIELKYCTYEDNECSYVDVICTNLNNGELIDYSEICGLE